MDQTIFCFNGFHSTEYFMFIDSATDDVSESIGRLIRKAGQEDASGSRRWYASMLANEVIAILTAKESK